MQYDRSAHGDRREILPSPKPGGSVTRAKAVYNSVYGTVSCGWTRTENGYRYAISVPSNTTARVILPDGTDKTVGAGEYIFDNSATADRR